MPNEMFTWYWFFSVIVVGILINLASTYLKNPLDSLMSSFSRKWRDSVKSRKDAYNLKLALHLYDPELVTITEFQQLRATLSMYFFVSAMVVGNILLEYGHLTGLVGKFFIVTFVFISIFLGLGALKDQHMLREFLSDLEQKKFKRTNDKYIEQQKNAPEGASLNN